MDAQPKTEPLINVESHASSSKMELKLSKSLSQQLLAKSSNEGVSPEELALELISEGLVLRAWEIMERKATLQKAPATNSNSNGRTQSGNRPNYTGNRGYKKEASGNRGRSGRQNHSHNGGGNRRGNGSANGSGNFQNVLDDRAAFLQYVRDQEKNG